MTKQKKKPQKQQQNKKTNLWIYEVLTAWLRYENRPLWHGCVKRQKWFNYPLSVRTMGKILSLGAAIKSTVYYQSFNIKGFFFFPRSWVPSRVYFLVINLIWEDVEDLACVASVSSRGSSRKLGQEQKKNEWRGRGRGKKEQPFFASDLTFAQ